MLRCGVLCCHTRERGREGKAKEQREEGSGIGESKGGGGRWWAGRGLEVRDKQG